MSSSSSAASSSSSSDASAASGGVATGVEREPSSTPAPMVAPVHVSVVWSFTNDYKRSEASIEAVHVGRTEESVKVQTALFIADELAGTRMRYTGSNAYLNQYITKLEDHAVDHRPAVRAALAYAAAPSANAYDAFRTAYTKMQDEEDSEHYNQDGLHWYTTVRDLDADDADARAAVVARVQAALARADEAKAEDDAKAKAEEEAKKEQKATKTVAGRVKRARRG